jgi:hypothetical protein
LTGHRSFIPARWPSRARCSSGRGSASFFIALDRGRDQRLVVCLSLDRSARWFRLEGECIGRGSGIRLGEATGR